jgi:Activator of Hsp90 ATPase homolog 1-like protein
MSRQFTMDPKFDFAIERFIDAPTRLVWEALTKPEHLKEWYMPKPWGRVSRAEMDVRPGGILRINIAMETVRSLQTSVASWKSFRWSDLSGPPCCSPAIVRLSLTTFRSPPS